MKQILLVYLLLLILATFLSDKQIIQQTLNGVFQQNKLPDSTTIVPCIDDETANSIVVFTGKILEKAARGSVSDLISIIKLVKEFGDQIPQSVKDCLDGNEEAKTLGQKYGINDTTNSSKIEKKIIVYITLHYLTVHKWFENLNKQWKAGKYYQVGFDAAKYAHQILGNHTEQIPEITNKQILQQGLNGVFEQNNLADSQTIIPCLDDDTASNIVVFIGQILDKAAKGSVKDFAGIIQLVIDFGNKIPQSVKDCLSQNAELKALGLKYNITEQTDPKQIEDKILAYITLNYLTVHKWFGNLNNEWKAAKYYQTGYDGATYAHTILSITPENIRKIVNIQ